MGEQTNTSGDTNIGGNVNTNGGDFIGRDKVIIELFSHQDDFVRLFNLLIVSLQNDKPATKQMLFEHHIEPVFRKLEEVHRDYQRTLFELDAKLAYGEVDFQKLYEWLNRERHNYRSDRLYLKRIYVEYDSLLSHFTPHIDRTNSSPNSPELIDTIQDFSNAITSYFMFDPDMTAYTSFIQSLEIIIKDRDCRDVNAEICEFRQTLHHIIEYVLFDGWEKIVWAYLKLRGLCLI
jgi:hypothetical protein